MEKVFKVSGKEDVLGRLRNIYVKIKKKAGMLQEGKTKYIKCKGVFIKLTTYIKEKAKPAAKPIKPTNTGKTVKISKRVSVINNISKIKDIRTRKLLEKTFKKNAKLYFIADNKRWKGSGGGCGLTGGIFTGNITNDVLRNRAQEADKTSLITTLESSSGITIRKICNLEYKLKIDGVDYIIRPYIIFKKNKIIIELYLSNDNLMRRIGGVLERIWISLPIHISQFFLKNNTERYSFIHITGEMSILQKYHISVSTTDLKINSQGKTHTYLMAENIGELLDILSTHGKEIFKDWETLKPDKDISLDEYYKITNYKWEKIIGSSSSYYIKSSHIVRCIEKLDEIFFHIFTTINLGITHLPPIGSSELLSTASSISVSAINDLSHDADKNYITGSNASGTTGTLGTSRTIRSSSPRGSRPYSASHHSSDTYFATRDRDRRDMHDEFERRRASPPRFDTRDRRDRFDGRRTSPPHLVFRDRSRSRDRSRRASGY